MWSLALIRRMYERYLYAFATQNILLAGLFEMPACCLCEHITPYVYRVYTYIPLHCIQYILQYKSRALYSTCALALSYNVRFHTCISAGARWRPLKNKKKMRIGKMYIFSIYNRVCAPYILRRNKHNTYI